MKPHHFPSGSRWAAGAILLALLIIIPFSFAIQRSKKATRKQPLFNHRAVAAYTAKGGEASRSGPGESDELSNPAKEQYENRAFPADTISQAQQQAAYLAFQSVAKQPGGKKSNWELLGPTTGFVVPSATY